MQHPSLAALPVTHHHGMIQAKEWPRDRRQRVHPRLRGHFFLVEAERVQPVPKAPIDGDTEIQSVISRQRIASLGFEELDGEREQ
jgi:hypothetical protein